MMCEDVRLNKGSRIHSLKVGKLERNHTSKNVKRKGHPLHTYMEHNLAIFMIVQSNL